MVGSFEYGQQKINFISKFTLLSSSKALVCVVAMMVVVELAVAKTSVMLLAGIVVVVRVVKRVLSWSLGLKTCLILLILLGLRVCMIMLILLGWLGLLNLLLHLVHLLDRLTSLSVFCLTFKARLFSNYSLICLFPQLVIICYFLSILS